MQVLVEPHQCSMPPKRKLSRASLISNDADLKHAKLSPLNTVKTRHISSRKTLIDKPIAICGWCKLRTKQTLSKHFAICPKRRNSEQTSNKSKWLPQKFKPTVVGTNKTDDFDASNSTVSSTVKAGEWSNNDSDYYGGYSDCDDEDECRKTDHQDHFSDNDNESSTAKDDEQQQNPFEGKNSVRPANKPKSYAFCNNAVDDYIMLKSIHLQRIVDHHRLSRAAHNDVLKFCNGMISSVDSEHEHLLTPYKSQKGAKGFYPVETESFHVCIKGCKMFGRTDQSTRCNHCKEERYVKTAGSPTDASEVCDVDREARAKVEILPIGEQLAYMLNDEATREQLRYRHTFKHRHGMYRDVFDGAVYQQLARSDGDGLFTGDFDIALALYIDGFQPFDTPQHTMTIVHIVVLNFDPNIRYKNKNMLQVCLIPGPNPPKDLESFLRPTLDELDYLETYGMEVRINNSQTISAKVNLLVAGGDMPAVKSLVNHAGHTAQYGCRICPISGEHHEGGHGMYFKDKDGVSKRWRVKEDFQQEVAHAGLKGPSLLASKKCFKGPEYFVFDEMHTLGHGVGQQFFQLLQGEYDMADCESPFSIGVDNVMVEMEQSRTSIPAVFNSTWKSLKSKTMVKAVDWVDFILYAVPVLVVPRLASDHAKRATMCLVRACQTALQYQLTEADVDQIESDVDLWHGYLRKLIDDGDLSVSVFTPVQHYITHMAGIIRKMGPLRFYSTRCLERMIGVYSKMIKCTSLPGPNAANVMVNLAMARYIDPLIESSQEYQDDMEKKKGVFCVSKGDPSAPEIWGMLKDGNLDSKKPIATLESDVIQKALSTYMKRNQTSSKLETKFRYAGRLFHKGCTLGSVLSHQTRYRAAYYVRLTLDIDVNANKGKKSDVVKGPQNFFAKAYFYFAHVQNDDTRLLALVGIYDPKFDKQTGSIFITPSAKEKLLVIDAAAIVGFFGLLTKVDGAYKRNYFIWPRMKSTPSVLSQLQHGNVKDIV